MTPLKYGIVMKNSGLKVLSKRYNEYSFLSVINNTDNTVVVYEGQVTEGEEKNSVITILPFTSLTVPIGSNQNYTFIYSDGGVAGVKKADIIFSTENLAYNSSLGPTVSGSMIITSTPATAADGAAGLPTVVGVMGGYDGVNVQVLKTDAAGELQVDIVTLPVVALARDVGRTSTKITAAGAGTEVVSAVAGKVWGYSSSTAAVTVELLDNATGKWFLGALQSETFPVPIACLTSIRLTFSGAGAAYIIWE